MISIGEKLAKVMKERGLNRENASSLVCQEILISKISSSPLANRVRLKGGVIMFKGTLIAETAVTAGQNIPLNAYINTNNNTEFSNGVVSIKTAGFYEVTANVVVTGVAVGDISLQLFNNGVALPEAIATATSTSLTKKITLPVHDVIRIGATVPTEHVNLSFRLSADATITNANVTVGKIH